MNNPLFDLIAQINALSNTALDAAEEYLKESEEILKNLGVK
jgi:hypothetical protein